MNETILEQVIKSKLIDYFFDKSLAHITTHSKRFYNGTIINILNSEGKVIIEDRKIGLITIYIKEILNIEPYIKRGEQEGGRKTS